ncbi:NUDIX hydrolase [Actinocorallia sp. A-T 12471]|uniref:NUDIX hydrolase n=1 Tax=Actinocorallia sp. A-T 12471 TaxID=3089813 RepID=UPI0029CC1D1E|nr:NUDIX hydrolase [Actinocorallia sp. A-T 12471]MDX6739267.1 NUDIX hydrolase [Actinocorallia sp. A-T 12471]
MDETIRRRLRVAAYAVVVEDGNILLARFIGGDRPRWILPGGGLEHGEDPADAVLRELTEETGYTGRITRLLGVHSFHMPRRDLDGDIVDFHGLRVLYEVARTGGELRHETDNSTDRAEWFPLSEIHGLDLMDQVNVALGMWRDHWRDRTSMR